MNTKDYYEILGIGKDASSKEINEAYAVLSDPEKRRQYDLLRNRYGGEAYQEFRNRYTEEDIFRGSDIQQIFDELSRAFGFSRF